MRAARVCFATYGYSGTTNRMIAERTGVTTAAIYHHFGRKSELMLAVHRATEVTTYERMRPAIDAAATFVAKVQAMLWVIHEMMREDPDLAIFASVARSEARRHDELREIAADRMFPDLFAELVAFGVETGAIAKAEAVEAQGAIAGLALGLALLASDMSITTHGTATEGCMKLVEGGLVRSSDGKRSE
jgi:AcrR family transcriptional regulator